MTPCTITGSSMGRVMVRISMAIGAIHRYPRLAIGNSGHYRRPGTGVTGEASRVQTQPVLGCITDMAIDTRRSGVKTVMNNGSGYRCQTVKKSTRRGPGMAGFAVHCSARLTRCDGVDHIALGGGMAGQAVWMQADPFLRCIDSMAARTAGSAVEHVVDRRCSGRCGAMNNGRARAAGMAGFAVHRRARLARCDGVDHIALGGGMAGCAAFMKAVNGPLTGYSMTHGAVHCQTSGYPIIMDYIGIVTTSMT